MKIAVVMPVTKSGEKRGAEVLYKGLERGLCWLTGKTLDHYATVS
jgi:hypothetical protein